MRTYEEFLSAKAIVDQPTGLDVVPPLNDKLFPFQRDIVGWALRRGRAAIFADCGMGKTAMQLEWAKHVPGNVLILAPLSVAAQTVREGEKFGIQCRYARHQSEVQPGIIIANYEMLEHFEPGYFAGVVLDESSILKAYDGKTRTQIIDAFARTPFKLACTATPAPNDYMELGNHAEFIGAMTRSEMLSMFFVHDGGETSQWRLKGHAQTEFWKWLCSWAMMMRKPGENPERVTHTNESFPVQVWQKYASPVWMDINPSDTLQYRSAREHQDERHICPLQLQVIERAMDLWTNPGDLVLSPFAGIGSEGYVAVKMGRRFIGSELKRSYWEQACRNLDQAKQEQGGLFAQG